MKTIYLVRHAKSSWAFELGDHDRPLGKRGRTDVKKMGKFLSQQNLIPDKMISSTASRAFYTALFFCDKMELDEGTIRLNKRLYHAGPTEILRVIQGVGNKYSRLALFGHNPGFTDCANLLSNSNIGNIPTCGVVGISFDTDDWKKVGFGKGKQELFYYPKLIAKKGHSN